MIIHQSNQINHNITNFNEAKSRIRQILHGVDHLTLTYID